MTFNEKEKEIIELIHNNNIDLNKISELLKSGADVNASNGIIEDEYYGSLLSECIYEALTNDINVLDLIKCFVENGFDLIKYGSSIIGDLHATFSNNDIIDIIKYILDSSPTKINVDYGIKMYQLESDYLSDDFAYYDEKANTIDTVAFMLQEYKNDSNYSEVYDYSKIIGQKVEDITIDNISEASNNNYMMFDVKNKNFNTIIKCEKDTLCIYNSLTAYVNNNKEINESNDYFINYLKENVKGSTITQVKFEHTFDKISYRNFKSSRNVKIYFSNGKELFYKVLTPGVVFARFVDLNSADLLKEYETVFLEQKENYLDSKYCVLPNRKARYNIAHNCYITNNKMMKFVMSNKEPLENEYISIDNESLEILVPYFVKHIMDFDRDEKVCRMTIESFLDIKKDLERLIRLLTDDEFQSQEYIECVKNFNYFTLYDYIEKGDDEFEYKDFNFNYAKEEIIDFIKAFIWYFNDYKNFNNVVDERVVYIYRY